MRPWSSICLLALAACGGSGQLICKRDPISGAERCQQSGGAAEAAAVGGVAAGVWVATGCTVNGCEPPFTCNGKTKLCERLTCSEKESCPPGYECQNQHCR